MDTVCGRDTGCSVFNTRKVCHKKSQFSSFLVSASLPYLSPTPHDQYLRVGEVAWDLLSLVFSRRPNMANSNFGCLAVSMQLIPNKDIFDVCSGKKSNASFKMVPLCLNSIACLTSGETFYHYYHLGFSKVIFGMSTILPNNILVGQQDWFNKPSICYISLLGKPYDANSDFL